ncbi:MAG: hypothetical protein HYX47_11275 [Burkholderiales bacterium]|nr:hypothetical protein [Burkholderiales bacterium]
MRDYWLTQYILGAIGWGYVALTLAAIALAVWLPRGKKAKVVAALAVMALASILPFQGYQEYLQQREAADAYRARLTKAQSLFDERCKTAGEKIYKTAANVEGVFVMKPRTEALNSDQQFKLDDPYGYAGRGDDYLKLFIRGRPTVPTKVGEVVPPSDLVTYKFVETSDESGSRFYRYTTDMSKDVSERITRNGGGVVPLKKVLTLERSAHYGITWDDISTREDRENWIAGSSQKIIDLRTNDVIAERIGYMFDKGLGSTSGGRSPWAAARDSACPPLTEKIFYFFDRVIKPVDEGTK